MTGDLEQRLMALSAALEVPPAPDLLPTVMARLPARPRHRRPTRRVLAIVVAGMLLLAGGAMAVPPTRDAILRVLGLRGVRIERVPRLPSPPGGVVGRLGLGQRIPLARARHAASFTALIPAGSAVAYLDHDVAGGRVSLLIGRVLVIEFRGTSMPFVLKFIGPGTTAKFARINGSRGVYLSGAPHEVLFQEENGQIQTDRVRLAGNVLLWQQGPVTLRIEGTRTLGQALTIARSLH